MMSREREDELARLLLKWEAAMGDDKGAVLEQMLTSDLETNAFLRGGMAVLEAQKKE